MKLKATISIIVRVIGKNDVHMNSMANFFLATLLFMRLLRMFFKLQSDFTDAGRRQIYYLKISRIPNVSEFFLKQLASLAVISFPKTSIHSKYFVVSDWLKSHA